MPDNPAARATATAATEPPPGAGLPEATRSRNSPSGRSRYSDVVFSGEKSILLEAHQADVSALQHLTPPRLGPLHLVEGVDVDTLDVAFRVRKSRFQAFDQTVGAVTTGQEQLEQPVTLPVQETRRLAEADAGGDPH